MFDVFYTGIKPNLFAHERECSSIEAAQKLSRTRYFWWVNYLTDYSDFDFLFEPVPWQNQYVHTWPSQWDQFYGACLVPTDATTLDYHNHTTILPAHNHPENFQTQIECKFDYSWAPHPWDPPYIYVFGNQWWPAVKQPTVEYHVPGATERKFIPTPRATILPSFKNWIVPDDVDVSEFDFSWLPDPDSPSYQYQFGTQWQKTGGPQYCVPGATEIKYIQYPRVIKTKRDEYWNVPAGAEVESFDWSWHPDATETPYIYQFGTQHQRTGGPQYCVPGATEIKYIDQIKIKTQSKATHVYLIDHLDNNASAVVEQVGNDPTVVRYFDNYLDTLKRIARNADNNRYEYVWITSSICDYANFDFSWHPEQWQATMLHVFPSDGEKFGDTFFMHVPTFLYRSEKLQLLEWYDINYTDISVPRRPLPVVCHSYDTHVEAVKTQDWAGPLALFTTDVADITDIPCVPLWREKTKTIVPLSTGAGTVIVPKVCVPYIKRQLYDYPHINRTQNHMYSDAPLDIVFISNGEPNAEANWSALKEKIELVPNRLVRSDGVQGRVSAYHAAAEQSQTPWFFAVFAKLRVHWQFNWAWQPDRLQEPKHYIFHAFNPINGLTYGHQAMIAYNRNLVLANTGHGLDFTLDSAHEVVPILSGSAEYAHSPWMAWRTAFRECIKLRGSTDVESKYRLDKWLSNSIGSERMRINSSGNTSISAIGQLYDHWSIWGAEDAVEYYDAVDGDFAELKKSYDWAWLASYALIRRNLTPDQ